MLSFLRAEGDAYKLDHRARRRVRRAWTIDNVGPFERRLIRALPSGLRARAALGLHAGWSRATYPGSRAITRVRRGGASIDLRGSLFCEVREASKLPLCGFYAAAIKRVLGLLDVPNDVQVNECRASGRQKGCLLSVTLNGRATDTAVAA